MPDEISDSLDAPIIEKIGGTDYPLPLLTMNNLGLIGRHMQNQNKAKALAGLPNGIDPETKRRIERHYDDSEPTVDEMIRYMWGFKGSAYFVRMSFVLSSLPGEPMAKQILDAISAEHKAGDKFIKSVVRERGWTGLTQLAARLSTFFPKESDPPNAAAGESPAEQPSGEASSPLSDSPADVTLDV